MTEFLSPSPPSETDAETSLSLPIPTEITPDIAVSLPHPETEVFLHPSDTDVEGSEDSPVKPFEALPTVSVAEEEPQSKPFVVEMLRLDVTQSGNFRPESAVQISRSLRTSGLLATLPAEDFQTLVAILTFTTANGNCLPNLIQLAEALNLSETQMRQRGEHLLQFRWQGQPLILPLQGGEVERYTPSPHLVAFVERPPTTEYAPTALQPRVAGRDAVIAYSRARYARPRVEVEALIAKQMGWEQEGQPPPENTPEREEWDARQTLKVLGVTKEQADHLLSRFPLERVQRQLTWLPYRHARNQLGFLLAAIEGDYEMPLRLRQEHATAQSEETTSSSEPPVVT